MKNFLYIFLFFIPASIIGQSFDMEYKNLLNEISFDVTYVGPPGEIALPRLARINYIQEDTGYISRIDDGILIRGNSNNNKTYTAKFSYTMIMHDAIGTGIKSQSWHPILKDMTSKYTVRDESAQTLFIFPFDSKEEGSFSFSVNEEKTWLFIGKYTNIITEGAISTLLYSSSQIETPARMIVPVYKHLVEFFGDLGINQIILIQSSLATIESFTEGNKLYVLLPNRGNLEQIRRSMVAAWDKKRNIGHYFFSLFKDTVLRLTKIIPSKDDPYSLSITLENSPENAVLVPPQSYYREWMKTGKWENNKIINVRAKDLVRNYALLHMAWYNIGVETLLNGIKTFFNQIPLNSTSEVSIDWTIITQDKLKEPLFSLYTKEILIENDSIVPHLEAKGDTIIRNSMNIPDLSIKSGGESMDILWNNSRIAEIPPLKDKNYYVLDSNRQVPQQSFVGSFYTKDKKIEQERLKILDLAKKNLAPGEQHFRQHLDIIEIPTIPYGNDPVKTIYIVISHILSNITGQLSDAIKETTIEIRKDGSMKLINTQLRV